MAAYLIDDHDEPPLRSVIGGLLTRTERADFAISRLRLDGLDLASAELDSVERCRLLLGRLDARTIEELIGGVERGPVKRDHLELLRGFLSSRRVEVRAAGIIAWNPDFSIFNGLTDAPAPSLALVGAHYFLRPYPVDGAAFTMVLTESDTVGRLQRRFDELWDHGYDVGEVVRAALDQLDSELASDDVAHRYSASDQRDR